MSAAPIPPGACTPDEHRVHRRLFLKGLAATGATAVTSFTGLFTNPAFALAAEKAQKKVILLWLCGAPSQFETWDPK
ncbi:MAG TPA: twin-arginine translocation signal domain-containing protein, partial [Chthoniobacteraceae bacterium]|nr:twin-arginine translocation signal domain-containing protein [Chthoniobacteraceae bacterium]